MPISSRIVLAILSRYCCHFLNWWRSTTRHPVFFCTQHNFWEFTCGLVLGCRPTDQVMTWGFVELGGFPVKLCIYCYICRADFRFFFPITYHLNSPSFSNCKGFLLLELFKLLLTGDRTICLNNNKNNDALGIFPRESLSESSDPYDSGHVAGVVDSRWGSKGFSQPSSKVPIT